MTPALRVEGTPCHDMIYTTYVDICRDANERRWEGRTTFNQSEMALIRNTSETVKILV